MKDQYFGDVNDYRKYALLRMLAGNGNGLRRLGVCWMLTPPDAGPDGRKLNYLRQPEKYRNLDPVLFAWLYRTVIQENGRATELMESSLLLGPKTAYFSSLVPKTIEDRSRYFDQIMQCASDLDLVFFDPDNGIEVKAVPPGRAKSIKYIYWNEINAVFHAGPSCPSVLIYQHYPFIKHAVFHEQIAAAALRRAGAKAVFLFPCNHALFLLLAQEHHINRINNRMAEWNGKCAGKHAAIMRGGGL